MNFAYLSDWTVTGHGRGAEDGTEELTGTCTDQACDVLPQEYNKDIRCYTAPNGILTAKSQSEVDLIITNDEKDKAYVDTLADINNKKHEENLKDFSYNGYDYVSDESNIQATQNVCSVEPPEDAILTLRGTVV